MVFSVSIRVDWDRQPVSVHAEDADVLESLIQYLKQQHNLRKRSIVMPDRETGGFLFLVPSMRPEVDCFVHRAA